MRKFDLKTPAELEIMAEGGKILREIKYILAEKVKVGVSAYEIDKLADDLVTKNKAEAAFKKVKNYRFATCINVNQGVVHGIPKKETVFKGGDLVSIDLGILYKGFYTDTSISLGLNPSSEVKKFLDAGKEALAKAASAIKPDRSYIWDISEAIEDTIIKHGYKPVLDLTGHGIGKSLHEDPYIPCFTEGKRIDSLKIVPGMALAIEVIYTKGSPNLIKENDGWTIVTEDDKIAGLFEDTLIVTEKGYRIIT